MTVFTHKFLEITVLMLVIILVNCIQIITIIAASEVQQMNFSAQNLAQLLNIQLGNVLTC